jgi:hypothetical protein
MHVMWQGKLCGHKCVVHRCQLARLSVSLAVGE